MFFYSHKHKENRRHKHACGYKSAQEKVDEVTVIIINQYEKVSYNYLRPANYNIWFTLLASTLVSATGAPMEAGGTSRERPRGMQERG